MKVNRKEFLHALESVEVAVAMKDGMANGSTAITFRDGVAYAYNGAVAASAPVPDFGECTVGAAELMGFLKKAGQDEVDVSVDGDEVKVSAGRSRAGLAAVKGAEMPDVFQGKKTEVKLPEGFSEAVASVLFSAGTMLARPEFGCVHIFGDTVETCDNYRLTRAKVEGMNMLEVLVPVASAKFIPSHKPTRCEIGNGWMHLKNADKVTLAVRLEEGEYPDLEPFIGQKGKGVDIPKDFKGALGRAMVFTGDDDDAYQRFTVEFSDEQVSVSGRSERGWFEESVKAEHSGQSFAIHVHPKHLLEILQRAKDAKILETMLKFTGDGFVHCCAFVQATPKADTEKPAKPAGEKKAAK